MTDRRLGLILASLVAALGSLANAAEDGLTLAEGLAAATVGLAALSAGWAGERGRARLAARRIERSRAANR